MYTDFGVVEIPDGEEMPERFAISHLQPRGAVAILIGKGRRRLFEDLANDTTLKHLLSFGVQKTEEPAELRVRRSLEHEAIYSGKWSKSAIAKWLKAEAFPVLRLPKEQFAAGKYLSHNPFGAVLIVKPHFFPKTEISKLEEALLPWAEKFEDKLKFTFFSKIEESESICSVYGIYSNDELLILENPMMPGKLEHTHMPGAPKYRLKGVTPERIDEFFQQYEKQLLPPHFRTSEPEPSEEEYAALATKDWRSDIHDLTSWTFNKIVKDPAWGVLVMYTGQRCSMCLHFEFVYTDVANRVLPDAKYKRIMFTRIDQTKNEHTEKVVSIPSLQFWPWGKAQKGIEIKDKTFDGILAFLEEFVEDSDVPHDEL